MAKLDLGKSPNAKMIKEVQEKSKQQANAITTIDLDIDLIDENPDNSSVFNMDDIERLAANIRQEGFFGSIEVYQKEDGRYEISSGHRRCRAAKIVGMKTIPATVTPVPEHDTKKRRKLIASNINNRVMTPMDWAHAIKYHIETLELEEKAENKRHRGERFRSNENRYDECASYFGMSQSSVFKYNRLNNLIPEIQELVKQNLIPWTSIIAATSMPEDVQIRVFKRLNALLQAIIPDSTGKSVLIGSQVENCIKIVKAEVKEELEPNEVPNRPVKSNSESTEAIPENNAVENFEQEEDVAEGVSFDSGQTNNNDFLSVDSLNSIGGIEDLPVIENERPEPTPHEIAKIKMQSAQPIDSIIFNVSRQLQILVNDDFAITDKNKLKENIDNLKKAIEVIENKL